MSFDNSRDCVIYPSTKSKKNLYAVCSDVIFLDIEQIFLHLNREETLTTMWELYISTDFLNKTILKLFQCLGSGILGLWGVSSIA